MTRSRAEDPGAWTAPGWTDRGDGNVAPGPLRASPSVLALPDAALRPLGRRQPLESRAHRRKRPAAVVGAARGPRSIFEPRDSARGQVGRANGDQRYLCRRPDLVRCTGGLETHPGARLDLLPPPHPGRRSRPPRSVLWFVRSPSRERGGGGGVLQPTFPPRLDARRLLPVHPRGTEAAGRRLLRDAARTPADDSRPVEEMG